MVGAVADAGVIELTHIVAIVNQGRGVVPPCGQISNGVLPW
jgi:hypothetical protein